MNLLTVNFISLLFLVVLVYEFFDCYCFLFTYYPFLGKCIMNTHTFFRDQCVFNISCDKDRGNQGGKKEKGAEKLQCYVTLSKSLKKNKLKNEMLHERKKWGWKMLILLPCI